MFREYMRKFGRTSPLFQTQINLIKEEKQKEYNIEKDKLFFDLLKIKDPIPEFEPQLEEPLLEVNNFKLENAFYNAFEKMKEELTWRKYKFPKIIFIKLYQNSKKLKKRIIKFSLVHLKRISEVIESYNPEYNIDQKKHNWEKSPKESYNSYYNIITRRNMLLDKEKEYNSNYSIITKEIGQKSDIVILTRNKHYTKDLIYSGKLCNVYIQNEFSRNLNINSNINDHLKNQKMKRQYFFSFNEPRYFIKKDFIENEKQKDNENESSKFITHEKQLFDQKNSHRPEKKGRSFNYSSLDNFNINASSTGKKNYFNYKNPSSRYKISLINQKKKSIYFTPRNNVSSGKLDKKIPKLKQFLLNKSDFYY